ncbi:MAG: hypothetical protein BWK80_31420 [Desulfobacteraceae bacterium IS3]|nr:MAG: hypothetical protein BWK80_31420 [Desulfobacteraceae bacterium IS3]
MEHFDKIANMIALTMGASWASGLNLYAAVLMLGVLGMTGNIALPPDLQILSNPLVVSAAGLMYIVEFFADKVPGVDTGWDALHTFIRIPAGALLAMGAVGDVNEGVSIAAALLGGTMAAGTHAAKAGTRLMINTSPEPFTNWIASFSEDLAVIGGLWVALHYPVFFIILLILFILMIITLLPKIWQGIRRIFETVFGQKRVRET